jgi:hypothetical protein
MSADSSPITPSRFAASIKSLTVPSLRLKLLEIRNSIAHLEYSNEQMRPFAAGIETALSSRPGFPTYRQDQGREPGEPDQDCVVAIRENEVVIARMRERIELIRAEAEGRGLRWDVFGAPNLKSAEDISQKDLWVEDFVNERGMLMDGAYAKSNGMSNGNRNGSNGNRNGNGNANANDNANANGNTHGNANGNRIANSNSTITNSANPGRHPAWTDGTIQTGTLRNHSALPSEPSEENNGANSSALIDRIIQLGGVVLNDELHLDLTGETESTIQRLLELVATHVQSRPGRTLSGEGPRLTVEVEDDSEEGLYL